VQCLSFYFHPTTIERQKMLLLLYLIGYCWLLCFAEFYKYGVCESDQEEAEMVGWKKYEKNCTCFGDFCQLCGGNFKEKKTYPIAL
jgi:hypothetical protein